MSRKPGAQPANVNALTHGARTEARVLPVSTSQKRAFLRRIGLRANQLDPVALGYLDAWSRCQAKVVLMDRWVEQHGWVDEEGNLPGFAATYFAAVNSTRLALQRLESHITARLRDPQEEVRAWIEAQPVEEDDDEA